MKYGDALPQRSVLEWLPHNLDYTEIKQLIKRNTIGRPLVKSPQTKTVFEDELFEVFMDQLGRIDLFVKSKAGEIERRLVHCQRQVAALRRRDTGGPLSSKRLDRYAKLEQEIERSSYDIQCLSRFVNVQRTGFLKLLKKYRKWSGSSLLTDRFLPIMEAPTSFHKIDFETNLLQVSSLLTAVRKTFNSAPKTGKLHQLNKKDVNELGGQQKHPLSVDITNSLSGSHNETLCGDCRVELDTALAMSSPAINGVRKEVFWVHYDHLIEVQVLLLKYLTLQTSSPPPSISSSPVLSRRHSGISTILKDEDVGIAVLDDLESFSDVHGSATVADVEQAGSRTAGQIRWCSRDSEAVIVVSDYPTSILNGSNKSSDEGVEVKLKKKNIEDLIDPTSQTGDEILNEEKREDLYRVRKWFEKHANVFPLAKILSKRTRFAGMASGMKAWALLDREIRMIKIGRRRGWMSEGDDDEVGNDSNGEWKTMEFPHAVLEFQWEGDKAPDLLKELMESHMVEGVRGFSLDVHAVSVLYQPVNMSPPFWLPALKRDIRKTPTNTPRHSRRSSAHLIFTASSSKNPSTGAASFSGANESSGVIDSSATPLTSSGSCPEDSRPDTLKRVRSRVSEHGWLGGERYWSEFNDDEDQDEPYTILVKSGDSDDGYEDYSLSEFITHGFKSTAHKVKRLFRPRNEMESTPLLRTPAGFTNELESGILSSRHSLPSNYLTFNTFDDNQPQPALAYTGFLSGAIVILTVTALLAANSSITRHKHKFAGGRVLLDLEVCIALLVAMVFGGVGLGIFLFSDARVGLSHRIAVWTAFAIVCAGSGAVFAMVGNSAVGA